jgi:hypothetical protein
MVSADPIQWLLPEANERRQRTARALVTGLRLVLDSGRSVHGGVVGLSIERARAELDQQTRRRLVRALLDLVRHGLSADLGPSSFASAGETELPRQAAWSLLEEHRDEAPWLPEVPAPNERSSATVERLLEAAARLGLAPGEERLWRVRAMRARDGQAEGERAWHELVESCERCETDLALAEALAGQWETLLDRGAVRAVVRAAEERGQLVQDDPRLAQLAGWARALAGEAPAKSPQPHHGELPVALVELREARPDLLPQLAGKVPQRAIVAQLARIEPRAAALRRATGASAVGWFVLRSHGLCELVEHEVAPALRERVREWARRLETACREPGSLEHRGVARAEACTLHRTEGHEAPALRGVLAPATTLAVAVAPVLDERGEVQGWLRLEFEHLLVPAREELAAAARAWRGAPERAASGELPAMPRSEEPTSTEGRDGPVAEALRALVAELGMKTAQRRWWGFEFEGERLVLACEGGAPASGPRGGGRALVRAQRSSAPVRFDGPSRELALAADSASGLVLPIRAAGVPCGFLALESTRRNDFPEASVQRWAERADRWSPLAIARFREWHRVRHGADVWFDEASGDGPGWVEHVLAVARASGPCSLSGPTGSGRRVVARWLQFEGGRGAAPLVFLAAGDAERDGFAERGPSAELLRRAREGVVVLFDIERLGDAGQLRLLELWERRASERGEPRWIAMSGRSPTELREAGALRPDLCRRLERLHLRVPALAQRRVELSRIAVALTRRCAAEEGVAAVQLDDSALALLWRQPWPGNLRELENFLFQVALMHAGRSVGADELERTARRVGVELLRRVPSRQPDPEFVRAALVTTANQRGSVNKTRAALYLGWDPDTLASRMAELGPGVAPS